MNEHLIQNNGGQSDIPNRALPQTCLHVTSTLVLFVTGILFFSPAFVARGGLLKPDVNLSNYDVPLYQQITNRIKAKILARLGEGKNANDRYFIIPFAYQNRGNEPELSHSFIAVIRVLADDKQPKLTAGLEKREYKNREFEAFTISWLPHDFLTNPNLCVFKGVGARISPEKNTCPTSIGRNCTLAETIKLAVDAKNAVAMWGPYEIKKEAFDRGMRRVRLLDSGTIRYRADDRLTIKDKTAINCFHAIAGIDEPFPSGGIFGTGFMMWGINGTARVLIEYKTRADAKHMLLEPIDVKGDIYGFVYAPTRNDNGLYNPFKNASAYQR